MDPEHLESLLLNNMLKKTSNNHSLMLMSNAIRALTIDAIEKANSEDKVQKRHRVFCRQNSIRKFVIRV